MKGDKQIMKRFLKNANGNRNWLLTGLALVCAMAVGSCLTLGVINTTQLASAESGETAVLPAPVEDTSPAIYVAEKNAHSVVGIITNTQGWTRQTGVQNQMIGQGSGVVIAEGGYVLTNNHVIESGNSFQVLMPSGDKVDATIVGTDSSLDLAVLKVEDQADTLVPVTIGSVDDLHVGSTVIAIGNPGGEVLANTVTQGIVSALERSSINSRNSVRTVNYIQHDAAINSGNSGGGLFDYQGNLIGINTLKYGGSYYSATTYEGLGFAIPVDTVYKVATQLIEHGKVLRPQMGVNVMNYDGPDEPMDEYAPASVCVMSVDEGTPAERAGIKQYDFITAVNGERVTNLRDLTNLLDQCEPGDTVTLTIVRYNNVSVNNYNSGYSYAYPGYGNGGFGGFGPFGGFDWFGNYGGNNGDSGSSDDSGNASSIGGTPIVSGGYTTLTVDVTLEVLD